MGTTGRAPRRSYGSGVATRRGTCSRVAFLPMSGRLRGVDRLRSGDYAWATIIVSVIAYELIADDLLSEATDRYRASYPLLQRLVVLAVAGHLGGMIPGWADVFSSRNLLHQGVVTLTHMDRRKRAEKPS